MFQKFTNFDNYNFYDCGGYGLFTLHDETFQPTVAGRRAYSPEVFFKDRANRSIDSSKHAFWADIEPVLSAWDSPFTCLDVGGYIGTFCIPLCLLAKQKGIEIEHVYSFEPGRTGDILDINIETNQLSEQVTLKRAAMSNFDGYTIYRFLSGGSIGGTVYGSRREGDRERIAPCYTVDKFVEDNNITGNVFIKLDTQGHEPRIMQNAKRLIKEKRAVWYIEFMEWSANADIGGEKFVDMICREFHSIVEGKEILPEDMPDFLGTLDSLMGRMADLLLVPRNGAFTDQLMSNFK